MGALSVRIWRSRWLPVAGAVVCATLIPMGLASAASAPRLAAPSGAGQWGCGDPPVG